MKTIITNGKLVLEDKILTDHDMWLEGNKITAIEKAGSREPDLQTITYDAAGNYILPGMIDIHSDMIESYIQPRSTAIMDFEMGLMEAEKALSMCGITTMFHSISMFRDGTWDVKEIRKAPQVKRLAALIAAYRDGKHLTKHRYHLRYEIDNLECYGDVKQMLEDGCVDLISFMDHSPGQGQYKNLEVFKKHQPNEGKDLSEQDFIKLVHQEMNKETVRFEDLKALADMAIQKGISIASHDDDTIEKLNINKELGVKISEFPITLEVAKGAVEKGFLTVLGAPNILLGGSHSGNLSALDAIREGAASVLVSDYYPQSLLQAVFFLHHHCDISLPQAVRFVSLNPARAVGLDAETGSIEVGKQADILIVDAQGAFPVIQNVFVDGACVLACQYQSPASNSMVL